MPLRTRSKHHKSRRGCTTCKQRHIRCDETLPRCLNCVKHRSACHYSEAHHRAVFHNKFLVQSQGDKHEASTELALSLAEDHRSESDVSVVVAQSTECGPESSKTSLRSLRCGPEPSEPPPRSLGSYLGVSTTMTPEIVEQLAACKYTLKVMELVFEKAGSVHMESCLTSYLQSQTRSCPC